MTQDLGQNNGTIIICIRVGHNNVIQESTFVTAAQKLVEMCSFWLDIDCVMTSQLVHTASIFLDSRTTSVTERCLFSTQMSNVVQI